MIKEWLQDKKAELEELNFGLLDFVMSILTAVSVLASLQVIKFVGRKFNASVSVSLIAGSIFFIICISIILFVMERKHKDDIDEEDYDIIDEDDEYIYYYADDDDDEDVE